MSACYKHIKTHERSKSESENSKLKVSTDLQDGGNGIGPSAADSGQETKHCVGTDTPLHLHSSEDPQDLVQVKFCTVKIAYMVTVCVCVCLTISFV